MGVDRGREGRGGGRVTRRGAGLTRVFHATSHRTAAQKIRTVDIDGKLVKLQMVRVFFEKLRPWLCVRRASLPLVFAVGHGRARAVSDYNEQLLPGRARHHGRVFCRGAGAPRRQPMPLYSQPTCEWSPGGHCESCPPRFPALRVLSYSMPSTAELSAGWPVFVQFQKSFDNVSNCEHVPTPCQHVLRAHDHRD